MDHRESNGYVTHDVTWPWKVKVVTPICLGSRISETAGDSNLVTMERLYEMGTWESNGHVTDDVTRPWTNIVSAEYLGNVGDNASISSTFRDIGL